MILRASDVAGRRSQSIKENEHMENAVTEEGLTELPVTPEAQVAAVRRVVGIFEQGCSNTFGKPPENCPECVRGMLNAIKWAIGDAPLTD